MCIGIIVNSKYTGSLQQMNEFDGNDNGDDHVGQTKVKLNNEGCLGEAEGDCWFCLL